jgi:hypothetical protein
MLRLESEGTRQIGDPMAEGGQQQQQQQQSPVQSLTNALAQIRRVQHMLELNYPQQTDAISMQRRAGDLVWQVIQSTQQQQGQ